MSVAGQTGKLCINTGRGEKGEAEGRRPKEKAMVREVRTLQNCFEATSNKILQQLVSYACAFTVCSGGLPPNLNL